jgi:hypothetical protein
VVISLVTEADIVKVRQVQSALGIPLHPPAGTSVMIGPRPAPTLHVRQQSEGTESAENAAKAATRSWRGRPPGWAKRSPAA